MEIEARELLKQNNVEISPDDSRTPAEIVVFLGLTGLKQELVGQQPQVTVE